MSVFMFLHCINKTLNGTPRMVSFQHLLMHCWWPVFILFLQRMMKLVSWTACWRRCSPVLPSNGREAHGQQVLSYTQNIKSTNVSKYVQNSQISINVHFLPSNTHVGHEAYPPVFSLTLFLSAHDNRFCLCSPSVFHLLYGSQTELCFSFCHGYRGQSWFQQ